MEMANAVRAKVSIALPRGEANKACINARNLIKREAMYALRPGYMSFFNFLPF
jgi:hypothetical protein